MSTVQIVYSNFHNMQATLNSLNIMFKILIHLVTALMSSPLKTQRASECNLQIFLQFLHLPSITLSLFCWSDGFSSVAEKDKMMICLAKSRLCK